MADKYCSSCGKKNPNACRKCKYCNHIFYRRKVATPATPKQAGRKDGHEKATSAATATTSAGRGTLRKDVREVEPLGLATGAQASTAVSRKDVYEKKKAADAEIVIIKDEEEPSRRLTPRQLLKQLVVEHDKFIDDFKKFTAVDDDNVITGRGKINGRVCFLYSQDFTVPGGPSSVSITKIVKVLERAMEVGAPIIGLIHSGSCIQEGDIFQRQVKASGVIPQISVVRASSREDMFLSTIADFTFLSIDKKDWTSKDLRGATAHSSVSGVVTGTLEKAFEMVKKLFVLLPANNRNPPPIKRSSDPCHRTIPSLDTLVPFDPTKAYDVLAVIYPVVDDGEFFEISPDFAKNIVVGFGRMNGRTVGFVGNQPTAAAGCLDADASVKGARFVRFCDAFNIPVITFVDEPGFVPGTQQECGDIIRHGSKLLYAYAEATVPKITVIARKAYGGGYNVVSFKHLCGDLNYAWPTAEVAVMEEQGARSVQVDGKETGGIGFVDDIIKPHMTRKRICEDLEVLATKKLDNPWKKHGNIPF